MKYVIIHDCSYILKVPFNADGASGIVYVWIGERSDPEDGKLTDEIANWMYDVSVTLNHCFGTNCAKFYVEITIIKLTK